MNNSNIEFIEEEGSSIKDNIFRYLRFWPYFLAGVIIALAITKIRLRYSQNIYNTYATIKILDQNKGGDIDLSGLPIDGFKKDINLSNEVEILRSKRLLMKVIDNLNLETTYYSKGKVLTSELFGSNIPFKVKWISNDSNELSSSPTFNVVFRSANTYDIWLENGFRKENIQIEDWVNYKDFKFKLEKIPGDDYEMKAKNGTEFSFNHKSQLSKADQLTRQLRLNQVGQSEILMLALNGPIKEKSEIILNEIIRQFDEDGKSDRRAIAKNTEQFVNERLTYLVNELDSIESSLVTYKNNAELVSVEIDASKYTQRDEQAFSSEVEANLQLLLAKSLQERFQSVSPFEYLPSDIGLADDKLNQLIESHNQLISQRIQFLQGTTESHPSVQLLNSELAQSLENLRKSINNYILSTQERLDNLMKIKQRSSQNLSTIPYKEKVLRNINRQQAIKENLYLFLLEKRETASLTSAVTAPSIKVVDWAFTDRKPVAPDRRSKYIIAVFLGLIIPFILVFIRLLLDSKIHSKDDLLNVLGRISIPIIGEIPLISKDESNIITKNDRSELAEAFRVIRTNLSYMSNFRDKDSTTIIVTSSTKSEGKTFTSYNTAITLASSNNKVLLIGADLRNPQLHTALGMDKNTAGLTTYLHDSQTDLNELIVHGAFNFDNLDVILSGYIPPNPAELLLNGRFKHLLEEVKSLYDYVIIDSAPTLLVTDTFLIGEYADACVYMTRAGVTDKKVMDHIIQIKKNNKLPNLGVVLNGIGKSGSYGYGYKYQYNYGYGYSYTEDKKKKKWWKVWK